jgi:hypothetical protein
MKIGEVIKGVRSKIEDLQLQSTLGMPPKVRAGRERMALTVVANIKKVKEECTKLCEKSAQIWTNLVEDPGMKVVEAKLREAQEKGQEYLGRINTLPPAECMTTILAQRQSYVEVE